MTWRSLYKRLAFPLLGPLMRWYLRKPRTFREGDMELTIAPGVFHPGFFLSTKVLLEHLETIPLNGKSVLELGAGSGLLSIYAAKQGAKVVATDISKTAVQALRENAGKNEVEITILQSDLFDHIPTQPFDLVLINPPYYPKAPDTPEAQAWYCGENFEYFHQLFPALQRQQPHLKEVVMILSEDCQIEQIKGIAGTYHLQLEEISRVKRRGEWNYLYEVRPLEKNLPE